MTRRGGFLSGDSFDDGWELKPHKVPEADVDVTPLVDCVFLLLSFFMLTSSMQGDTAKNIPAAANGSGVDPNQSTSIRVVAAEPEPVILLDNRESSLDDVAPFVEAGLNRGHSLVVIKADREIRHGFVQQVVREVNSVDGATFAIGVLDKKR